MPKTRAQKETLVASIAEKIRGSKSLVFAKFAGVQMKAIEELRRKARTEDVAISVAKKTLLRKAMESAGFTGFDPAELPESIMTAIGLTDEVAAARLLAAFAKGKEHVEIVGGMLEGVFTDGASMKRLAALPTKQQLYGQLVGTMQAPISGLANVLVGNIRSLVQVLGALQKKLA